MQSTYHCIKLSIRIEMITYGVIDSVFLHE